MTGDGIIFTLCIIIIIVLIYMYENKLAGEMRKNALLKSKLKKAIFEKSLVEQNRDDLIKEHQKILQMLSDDLELEYDNLIE